LRSRKRAGATPALRPTAFFSVLIEIRDVFAGSAGVAPALFGVTSDAHAEMHAAAFISVCPRTPRFFNAYLKRSTSGSDFCHLALLKRRKRAGRTPALPAKSARFFQLMVVRLGSMRFDRFRLTAIVFIIASGMAAGDSRRYIKNRTDTDLSSKR
jgi:hypothetical protein